MKPCKDTQGKKIQHPEYEKAPIDRRAFFAKLGLAGGIAGGVGYAALAPEGMPGSLRDVTGLRSEPKIKPLRLNDYRVEKPALAADVGIGRQGDVRQKLLAALDGIGGITHYIKPGDIVLVKPNVAFDRAPNLGATSNPELLEALIQLLLVDCRAQEVRVADNPIESPADCFAKSQVGPTSQRAGGRVYLPDSNAFKMLHTPGAKLIEN